MVCLLLQKCVRVLAGSEGVATFPPERPPQGRASTTSAEVGGQVSPMTKLGIEVSVRYGEYLSVLEPSLPNSARLENVLAKTRALLQLQQHSKRETKLSKRLTVEPPNEDTL